MAYFRTYLESFYESCSLNDERVQAPQTGIINKALEMPGLAYVALS